MTRESACELTANAMRDGMLALIRPVMTSTDGRCVATTRWIPVARAELRQTHDRRLDARRRDQHEVGQLVDDDHDVRQLFVGILGVVLFDLAHAGFSEALVARVHFFGHLEERAGGEARVGDDVLDEVRDAVVDVSSTRLGSIISICT